MLRTYVGFPALALALASAVAGCTAGNGGYGSGPVAGPANPATARVVAASRVSSRIEIAGIRPIGAPEGTSVRAPSRRAELPPGRYELGVRVEAVYPCQEITGACRSGCFDTVELAAEGGRVYEVDAVGGSSGCWLWVVDRATGKTVAGRRP